MSSTKRGSKPMDDDIYMTNLETIDTFLDVFPLKNKLILEPCAGSGNIIKAIRCRSTDNHLYAIEKRPEEKDVLQIWADDVEITDFRNYHRVFYHDCIITNPPFSIAQEIIEHCFEITDPQKAEIIMLLRLGFLASSERKSFWYRHPLTQLYILSKRPSFGQNAKCKNPKSDNLAQTSFSFGCGWHQFYSLGVNPPRICPSCGGTKIEIAKTDSTDYGWFVWSNLRQPLIKSI